MKKKGKQMLGHGFKLYLYEEKKKINVNEDKEAILGVILKYYVFFF
jgi:hypothetical protein